MTDLDFRIFIVAKILPCLLGIAKGKQPVNQHDNIEGYNVAPRPVISSVVLGRIVIVRLFGPNSRRTVYLYYLF